jgi:large subunit ribosomal protein L13
MDMNKTFMLRKEDSLAKWHVIDASNQVLGRLSSDIVRLLRGKYKADYTPHTDNGDYVIVLNADKVKLSGNKWSNKMYYRYTGWRGGKKERTAQELYAKDPTEIIHLAVRGMMPKESALSRKMLTRLKVFVGDKHPHAAQVATYGV